MNNDITPINANNLPDWFLNENKHFVIDYNMKKRKKNIENKIDKCNFNKLKKLNSDNDPYQSQNN